MDEYHKCSLVQMVPSQPFEIASRTYFEPQTAETKGYAYATSINSGRPMLAFKMVTHNWSNKFAHLIGAIFADAQELETYDSVVSLLKNKDYGTVYQMLERHHQLDVPYWVCAFSVNQHAGICARAPPYDTSGCEIQSCGCCTEKHFEGDLSDAGLKKKEEIRWTQYHHCHHQDDDHHHSPNSFSCRGSYFKYRG